VLIDGFNLYHAIDDLKGYADFKWLNIKTMSEAVVKREFNKLIHVFFFTALPTWDDGKRARHQRLLDVYEDLGVTVVKGDFKLTTSVCKGACQEKFETYKEKMTDINICLQLIRCGEDDIADVVYVITGDNDQVASMRCFREKFPSKEVVVVIPPNRRAEDLKLAAHRELKLNTLHLNNNILPNPYACGRLSKRVIHKPENWVSK
jgi:uncharacterized LabA/DUF88 family protein